MNMFNFAEMNPAVKVLSNEAFVAGFEALAAITEEKQDGIKYSVGTISNWVSKWILSDPETIRRSLIASKHNEGNTIVYTGLTGKDSSEIEAFAGEVTKAKIFNVSYHLDKRCYKEIQSCIWSDSNINKFRKDMIMIGRLYQEKTIDYAKKISFLDIIPSPMKFVSALSLMGVDVRLVDKHVNVYLPEVTNPNRIELNDIINRTRTRLALSFKEEVEESVIPMILKSELPDEIMEELEALHLSGEDLSIYMLIKQYYKDIVGGFVRIDSDGLDSTDDSMSQVVEAFKSDKLRLENMLRMATRYHSPEERGARMKYTAGRTANDQKREDGSENRFYLSLCKEEYVKWLMSIGLNEIDFSGYKLLGNKGYQAGDLVWFENGQSAKATTESTHTGWMEIKEFSGKLYATIQIDELISIPEVDGRIIIKVQQGFVKSWGSDAVVKALTAATEVKISTSKLPVKYKGNQEKPQLCMIADCMDGKTRNIPFDLSPAMFSILRDSIGDVVKVSKNVVKTQTGDLIDSVYVSIDLKVLPEIMIPEGVEPLIVYEIIESGEI